MRISTYALHQSTLRNAVQTQADLAEMQGQLSSGFKSRNFAGISSQTEQYLILEGKLSKTQVYQDNNKIVQTRIATTGTILDQVIETATNLRNLVSQRLNASTAPSLAFKQQLDAGWHSLVSQLNTSAEGRYLFGGTRTDVPPVDATNFPTVDDNNLPNDKYYFGSNEDLTVRPDDNIEMVYNVRANDPGIQKIFAAIAIAGKNDPNQSNDQLKEAFDLLTKALPEVISAKTSVDANKVALDQINDRQISLSTYWKGVKEDITNTDLVSVSTQVAINEGILQASFQVFAKINSLRLSDYLR